MVAIVELPSLVSETKIFPNHLLDLELVTALHDKYPEYLYYIWEIIDWKPGWGDPQKPENFRVGAMVANINASYSRGVPYGNFATKPVGFTALLPVIPPSVDSTPPCLVLLAAKPIKDLHTERVPREYYTKFEQDPQQQHTMAASLPIFSKTNALDQWRNKEISTAILGSAYSRNYQAVVKQLRDFAIGGKVYTIDINALPLKTLKAAGVRGEDELLRADAVDIPFPVKFFQIMHAHYLLNCMAPSKLSRFFPSVAEHLAPDGVLLLSISVNNTFRARNIEGIPFAFTLQPAFFRSGKVALFHRATLEFYVTLIEQAGLSHKVVAEEESTDPEVRNYLIIVKHA